MIVNLKYIKKRKKVVLINDKKLVAQYLLVFISCLFSFSPVFAEYRVFQYWFISQTNQKSQLVTSTLDPKSYLAYYGKNSYDQIQLIRSWICYGDTSKLKEPCQFQIDEEVLPNNQTK